MSNHSRNLLAAGTMVLLVGCVSPSATEEDFGNSVRNVLAKQQIAPTGPLQPDEPLQSGNGRRLENVNSVYQGNVGDPSPVVRQVEVDSTE